MSPSPCKDTLDVSVEDYLSVWRSDKLVICSWCDLTSLPHDEWMKRWMGRWMDDVHTTEAQMKADANVWL